MLKHRLVIARLKKLGGIWRVDGVGDINDRGRLGKHAAVHLAGIKDEFRNNAYVKEALNGKIHAFHIHTAQLIRLKTGSIWEDGKLIRFSPEISEICEIDAGSAKIRSLDESFQFNNTEIKQIIPSSHFAFGSDQTSSNREKLSSSRYVFVEADTEKGKKWLVIPCSEILRFYFGVSSRLLSSTIAGDLDTYYDYDHSTVVNHRLKIHALMPLSRFEASVLGRAVASQYTRKTMLNVFNHISATKLNNASKLEHLKEPLKIEANFPFEDKTALSISGKRMLLGESNGKEIWGIFVMQIWHCTHSFGFSDSPIIEYPFATKSMKSSDSDPGLSRKFDYFLPEENQPDIAQVPANSRAKRSTILTFSNQFSGLSNMRFQHQYKEVNNQPAIKYFPEELKADALTFEGGSGAEENKHNQGILISNNQVRGVGREQSLFISTIKEIKSLRQSWNLSTLNLDDDSVIIQGEFLSHFPPLISGLRNWHLIDKRPRQVIIVELRPSSKLHIYLFEMELKGNESGQCTIIMNCSNFNKIEPNDISNFLILSARNNRWISPSFKLKKSDDRISANEFFAKHTVFKHRHPSYVEQKTTEHVSSKDNLSPSEKWALELIDDIENLFGITSESEIM